MSGQADIAAAALEGSRRVQPGVPLAWIAREMPTAPQVDQEHYLKGLHRAGLNQRARGVDQPAGQPASNPRSAVTKASGWSSMT